MKTNERKNKKLAYVTLYPAPRTRLGCSGRPIVAASMS